jgi:heme exporter protein D
MDWGKFFSMGGYGFYVWGSYLFALVAMGGEVIALWRRKKNVTKQFGQNVMGSEIK